MLAAFTRLLALGSVIVLLTFAPTTTLAQSMPCVPQAIAFFSSHLDPVLQEQLQQNVGVSRQPSSAPNQIHIHNLASKILTSHKTVLEDKKQELSRILTLAKTQKISWVGIELPDTDVQSFAGREKEQRDLFVKKLTSQGLSKNEAEDLALLSYDSVQSAIALEPNLFKNVKRVGLEDETHHQNSLDMANSIESLRASLEALMPPGPVSAHSLQKLENEVGYILGEKNQVPTPDQKRLVDGFPSAETKKLAEERLAAARKLVAIAKSRDQITAKKLAKIGKEPGIFTLGRAHEDGVRNALKKGCFQ